MKQTEDTIDTYYGRADDGSSLLALPRHHGNPAIQTIGKPVNNQLILLKPNGVPVFSSIETKATTSAK